MSQVTRRGPVKPSLNITPLIDVVFLLIIFFMIVNNIVTDENPDLQLPDPEEKEVFAPKGESRVIVNIVPAQQFGLDKNGKPNGEKTGPGADIEKVLARNGAAEWITVGNKKWKYGEKEQMEEFAQFLADTIKYRIGKDPKNPPIVLLRADAAIYYLHAMTVLSYMQQGMLSGGLDPAIEGQTSVRMVAYMDKE